MAKVIKFNRDNEEIESELGDLEEVAVLFSTKFTTKDGKTRLLSLIKTDEGGIELGVTKSFDPNDGKKLVDMSEEDTIHLCNDGDSFVTNTIKEWLKGMIIN